MVLHGDYAVLADYGSGLRIIDITSPTAPKEVGVYTPSGYATNLAVAGDFVFAAYMYDGLRVADISDPTAPVDAGWYDTPGTGVARGDGRGVRVPGGWGGRVGHPAVLSLSGLSALRAAKLGAALRGDGRRITAAWEKAGMPASPGLVSTMWAAGRRYRGGRQKVRTHLLQALCLPCGRLAAGLPAAGRRCGCTFCRPQVRSNGFSRSPPAHSDEYERPCGRRRLAQQLGRTGLRPLLRA